MDNTNTSNKSYSDGTNINQFLSEVDEANQSRFEKINLRDYTYNPKSKDGVSDEIRIVPSYDTGRITKKVDLHWSIGKSKLVVCPAQYGRKCPICEYIAKMTTDGKLEEVKRMKAQSRYFLPVVIRKKETEGVKYWGFPKGTLNILAGFYKNKYYGDIAHIKTGRDLSLSSEKGAETLSITPIPVTTPLMESEENIDALRKSIMPIEKVFKELPYDVIDKILKRALGILVEKGEPEPDRPGIEYGVGMTKTTITTTNNITTPLTTAKPLNNPIAEKKPSQVLSQQPLREGSEKSQVKHVSHAEPPPAPPPPSKPIAKNLDIINDTENDLPF